MNPETQALIDRIANGTSTERDAARVEAFVEAFDAWNVTGLDLQDEYSAMLEAREALQ